MRFRKGVVAEIVARANASPAEVCGLLLGGLDRVAGVVHCINIASDPARAFEIDPRQLIAAHKAARQGGVPIIGCYHSHPGGVTVPSARDASEAVPNGWLWLIATGRGVGLYRAVERGRWHGRFDAVPLKGED